MSAWWAGLPRGSFTEPTAYTPVPSAADVRVSDRGELADQRGGEEDEAERELVEAAQLAAAGGEHEHDHGRDGQSEGEDIHDGSRESAPQVVAVTCGRL